MDITKIRHARREMRNRRDKKSIKKETATNEITLKPIGQKENISKIIPLKIVRGRAFSNPSCTVQIITATRTISGTVSNKEKLGKIETCEETAARIIKNMATFLNIHLILVKDFKSGKRTSYFAFFITKTMSNLEYFTLGTTNAC